MKLRRIAALAVVAIMLLGMVPSAFAAECPSEDAAIRNGGKHFWSEGNPTRATCTQPAVRYDRCVYCGTLRTVQISPARSHLLDLRRDPDGIHARQRPQLGQLVRGSGSDLHLRRHARAALLGLRRDPVGEHAGQRPQLRTLVGWQAGDLRGDRHARPPLHGLR